MDDGLQRRVAANEALFRELNEAIEQGQAPSVEDALIDFRCECASLECEQECRLTRREYERVRGYPRRFLVLPGHVVEEAETVAGRHDGYLVVEKRGEAGRLAEALDPRPGE